MTFQTRNDIFTLYRMFFISLFLLLGIIGIGSVLLEYFINIPIFVTQSEFDKQALQATFVIMGILGFSTAFMMIYLIKERRGKRQNRRALFKPFNFPDRRTNTDRREETYTD